MRGANSGSSLSRNSQCSSRIALSRADASSAGESRDEGKRPSTIAANRDRVMVAPPGRARSYRADYNSSQMRARTGSTLCPSCGQLVGVNDAQCLACGRRNPGRGGFASALRGLGRDLGFVPLVFWGCAAAYLATLASDPGGIEMTGLALGSPSIQSLFLFGASGPIPVFPVGRGCGGVP